jgi:hypothetical protein
MQPFSNSDQEVDVLGTNAVDQLALLPPFDARQLPTGRSKPAYVCASEIAFG